MKIATIGRIGVVGLSVVVLAARGAPADLVQKLLPADATVIETSEVKLRIGGARTLVIWMEHPKRVETSWETGPDFLYGNHWLGPTHLSLIDTAHAKLMNTIRISSQEPWNKGDFEVPFFVWNHPYYVPHPDKDRAGKPTILHLRDLTGEGARGQFALFDYVATAVSEGSLFGYCAKSDTAVQYPVEVVEDDFKPIVRFWVLGIFSAEISAPGHWDVTSEVGHGSQGWIHDAVRFDPGRQLFIDRRTVRPYPGVAQTHCDTNVNDLPEVLRAVQRLASGFAPSDVIELVNATPVAQPTSTMSFGRYKGSEVQVDVMFQKDVAEGIGIQFRTASDLAAEIQASIKKWCAN